MRSFLLTLLLILPLCAMAQQKPDFIDYLLADGRWSDVVQLTTSSLSRHSRDARLHAQRASAYLQLGRTTEAISDLTHAIQFTRSSDRSLLRYYYLRGALYEVRGDDRAAMRDYQRIIKYFPDSLAGYEQRAALLLRQRDYASAYVDYQRLLAQRPEAHDYRMGVARCQMHLHKTGAQHIDNTITYNNLYFDAHGEVDDLFDLAYSVDSDAVYLMEALTHQLDTITRPALRYPYLALRAVCYEDINDAARAMADLEALAAMSDAPSRWIDEHRALVCMSTGEWQRAADYYTALLSYDPAYDMAYIQRARCMEEMGDTLAAERDYQHMVTAHSLYSGYATYRTGLLYLNQRDYRSAEYAFTDALEDLQHADIYMARARAYVALDRSQAALRDLEQAAQLMPALRDDPDYIQLLNKLRP